MVDLELPALIGTDALGFLAALGVLRLSTIELRWHATLAWPRGPRNGAVLGGCPEGTTVESLADALFGIVEHMRTDGRLIPGVDGFPPAKEGSGGSDPIKDLSLADRSGLATTSIGRDVRFGDWLLATVAVAARQTDDSRDRLSAAFVRPTGQVTFDRSLKSGRDELQSDHLLSALALWKRVDGVTGNYFDQRAIRDEFVGMHTGGQMKNAGVPGAAWLALMALPMFPVRTPLSGKANTVAFQRRRGRPTRMVWPVWAQPLTSIGVAALLDHPTVARADGGNDEAILDRRERGQISQSLRTLGITAVFAANRRPGPRGGDGALGASEVLASASAPRTRPSPR